jgi:hypothetical protein
MFRAPEDREKRPWLPGLKVLRLWTLVDEFRTLNAKHDILLERVKRLEDDVTRMRGDLGGRS